MAEQFQFTFPTLSPLCDYLIVATEKSHTGELDKKSYAAIIIEKLALWQKAKEDILDKGAQPEKCVVEIRPEDLTSIKESMDELKSALDNAVKYAETQDEEAYNGAMNSFGKAGNMGRVIFEPYQPGDVAMGPTDVPMLNVLNFIKVKFFNNEVSRDVFVNAIYNTSTNARIAANEMAAMNAPDSYPKSTVMRAYCDFADIVDAVEPAIEQGVSSVDSALSVALESAVALRKAVEGYTLFMATSGPTQMSHANLVLTMAESWQNEAIPDDVFVRAMDVFRKSLDDLSREIESLASVPNDCEEIAKQMVPTREGFAQQFASLDLFARCVNGEPELYDEARELLIKGAEQLAICKEAFDKIGEQVGQIPCVRCGSFNEPSNRCCSKCGAKLFNPSAAHDAPSSTMSFQEEGGQVQYGGDLVMTKNLVKVFTAVNEVSEEKITLEQYQEVMNWFKKLVEDNLIDLEPEPEFDTTGLNPQEIEQLRLIEAQIIQARVEIDKGAHEMVDAMDDLLGYKDRTTTGILVDGVRELRDASIKVQKSAHEIAQLVQACKAASAGEQA